MSSQRLSDLPQISAVALNDPFYIVDTSLGIGGSAKIYYEDLFGEIIRDVTIHKTDANVDTLSTVFTLRHSSTGSVISGFGGRLDLRLESATNSDRQAGAIDWYWTTATDATRTSVLRFLVVDTSVTTQVALLSKDGLFLDKEFFGTGTLSGFIGTVGSSSRRTLGQATGTAGMAATAHVPQWNIQSYVNGDGTGTGYNYLFVTRRVGAGTLNTLGGLCSYIESDQTTTHEIIAVNAFMEMLAGSVGSGFGLYAQAGTASVNAAATGIEIATQNACNAEAPYIGTVTGVAGTNGIILTAFKSGDAAHTLSEFCTTAIWISAGQPYGAGPGGGANFGTQWRSGIAFTGNSYAGYGIDFVPMGAAAPPSIRFSNATWVVGRNQAGAADINLFRVDTSNNLAFIGGAIYFPSSGSNVGSIYQTPAVDVTTFHAMYGWGTGVPVHLFHRALGTVASPTALTSGTRIAQFRFSGNYDTTIVPAGETIAMASVLVDVDASGNWDATNAPADFIIRTRKLVADTPFRALIVTSDRRTVIGDAVVHADATETFNVIGTGRFTSIVYLGSAAADPAVTNGGIYYNTTSGKLRGCEGGAWANLI